MRVFLTLNNLKIYLTIFLIQFCIQNQCFGKVYFNTGINLANSSIQSKKYIADNITSKSINYGIFYLKDDYVFSFNTNKFLEITNENSIDLIPSKKGNYLLASKLTAYTATAGYRISNNVILNGGLFYGVAKYRIIQNQKSVIEKGKLNGFAPVIGVSLFVDRNLSLNANYIAKSKGLNLERALTFGINYIF